MEFFATPDAFTMASMSEAREGWMMTVARGQRHRTGATLPAHTQAAAKSNSDLNSESGRTQAGKRRA
jgi:hypothetical protein